VPDLDGKTVISDGELFIRNGDDVDGISPSGLAAHSAFTSVYVADTGDQTIAGVKTFSSSPIVPTPSTDFQAATKKYVDDNIGGGSGDISTTDTTVAPGGDYWDWVDNDDTMAADSDTVIPTQGNVVAYVASQAVTANLASTDTDVIDIYTSGGVTYLDVSGVAGAASSFDDDTFDIHDEADPTKIAQFSVGGLTTATTRTYSLPDVSGTLAVTSFAQTWTAVQAYDNDAWITSGSGLGLGGLNDFSRSHPLEVYGITATTTAAIAFLTSGIGGFTQSLSGSTLGELRWRGHTGSPADTTGYAGGSSARVTVTAAENITAGARGANMSLGVASIGSTLADVLSIKSTADIAVNAGIVAGVGSSPSTAAPASNYTIESRSGAIGYGVGSGSSQTQATNKATTVVLSKPTGQITLSNANLAADTTVSFTLTNTYIDANDILVFNHLSGGTLGAYIINAQAGSGSATVNIHNATPGALAEAIVIQFALIKGVIT
jgi:hypothetical protein